MIDKPSIDENGFSLLVVLLVLAAFGVVLASSGFIYAASQETNDVFCGSCHTQPESTFLARSNGAQPVDLASFHTTQNTRCIDCHSGPGLFGRMQAELLGARNAASWYLHTATQPARLTFPIQDPNCLKCHQDVTQRGFIPRQAVTIPGGEGGGEEEGRNNHWHEFLSRWQAADPTAGGCTNCHPGHLTNGTPQTGFQDVQATRSTCDACHSVLRERGSVGGNGED